MSMHDLAAVRKDRPRTRRELTDDPMFPDVMGARVHHLNPVRRDGRFSPDVDVSETGGRFEVTAELPGLQEKDIHITLNDGVLIVKGEKRSDTGRRDVHKRHHCRERGYGAFRRCIGLPPEIDTDRVSARLDKGVLRIVFSKKTAVRAEDFTRPPDSQFKFWLLPPPADGQHRNGRPVRSLVRAVRRFLHH